MSTQTFTVTGMTCGHCVASVTEEVSEVAGVDHVDVVLETGTLTVTSAEPVAIGRRARGRRGRGLPAHMTTPRRSSPPPLRSSVEQRRGDPG